MVKRLREFLKTMWIYKNGLVCITTFICLIFIIIFLQAQDTQKDNIPHINLTCPSRSISYLTSASIERLLEEASFGFAYTTPTVPWKQYLACFFIIRIYSSSSMSDWKITVCKDLLQTTSFNKFSMEWQKTMLYMKATQQRKMFIENPQVFKF